MFSGHGGPGHKFIDAVGVMAIGEAGEGLGQPRVRIDGKRQILPTFRQ